MWKFYSSWKENLIYFHDKAYFFIYKFRSFHLISLKLLTEEGHKNFRFHHKKKFNLKIRKIWITNCLIKLSISSSRKREEKSFSRALFWQKNKIMSMACVIFLDFAEGDFCKGWKMILNIDKNTFSFDKWQGLSSSCLHVPQT